MEISQGRDSHIPTPPIVHFNTTYKDAEHAGSGGTRPSLSIGERPDKLGGLGVLSGERLLASVQPRAAALAVDERNARSWIDLTTDRADSSAPAIQPLMLVV